MSWIDLSGEVAVVTGAGAGIGRGIALGLADVGATLVLLDRDDASSTLDEIASRGGRGFFVRCDVTDDGSVGSAAAQSLETFGPATILVNNAGTMRAGQLVDMPIADWQQILSLNLTGYLRCAQAFGAQMLQRGQGSLIHVASISARAPQSFSGAYSASKAAVVMLSQQLAVEWGPKGVRSNVVSPGLIRTPMTQSIYDAPGVLAARRALVPRRRIGEPEDVANAVVFLASERADYITGAEIVVDGGFTRGIMASSLGRASKHISPAEDFLPVADVQDIRVTATLSCIPGFTKIELLDPDIYFLRNQCIKQTADGNAGFCPCNYHRSIV